MKLTISYPKADYSEAVFFRDTNIIQNRLLSVVHLWQVFFTLGITSVANERRIFSGSLAVDSMILFSYVANLIMFCDLIPI